jgi:hypothetical protein
LDEIRRLIEESQAPSEPDAPDQPDITPPDIATGITAEKHENYNRIKWTNPPAKDLYKTEIYRKDSQGGSLTRIAVVAAATEQYDDLDTNPTKSYWYYLICFDDSGNQSAIAPLMDGANAVSGTVVPAPNSITAQPWKHDDLILNCDPVDVDGVSGYLWMVVSHGVEIRSFITGVPEFTYTFAMNATDGLRSRVEVRVWAMDANGDPSSAYSKGIFEHAVPPAPAGVTVETQDLGFIINWSPAPDGYSYSAEIGLSGHVVGLATEPGFLHKSLLKAGSYQFAVRFKNKFGQLSPWNTQTYVVFGPNRPGNFHADVISNTIVLYWDAPAITELPIAEYEIRKGDWDNPTLVRRKKGTFTPFSEAQAGFYTYNVAAVDTAENIGAHSTIDVRAEDPPGYELNVEWENDFSGGTSHNILVLDDGTAYAPCYVDRTIRVQFVGNGSMAAPQFNTIQDMIDAGHLYPIGPVPPTASYAEEQDYGAILSVSTITSTLSREPTLGDVNARTFLGTKENIGDAYAETESTRVTNHDFRYVRERFLFESNGIAFAKFLMHTLRLDSKPESESFVGEITDADQGITFAFTKQFADVKNIAPTYYGDGTKQLIPVVDFNDVPYPTGFTIFLVGASGKDVGKVGARAEGWV